MQSYHQFQQQALLGNVSLTFTDALRAFCERHELPPEDRYMLAQVHYRGNVPQTEADWWFIYRSIQLVIEREL